MMSIILVHVDFLFPMQSQEAYKPLYMTTTTGIMYIAKLPVFQSLYVLKEGEVSEMWLAKTRRLLQLNLNCTIFVVHSL